MLRDHGSSRKYHHEVIGYNGRLDGIQAAVLGVKLAHLDRGNERRRKVAQRYRELLRDEPLALPPHIAEREGVYHLFVIRSPQREGIRQFLREEGIESGLHYPTPLHLQPAFVHLGYLRGDFPRAERLADQGLSLPMFPELTDDQVERVGKGVVAALEELSSNSKIQIPVGVAAALRERRSSTSSSPSATNLPRGGKS